jgi:glycosyltransferase involved in cell wall biosynthesis
MTNRKRICLVVSSPVTVLAFLRGHIAELSKHAELHLVVNMEGFDLNLFAGLPLASVKHIGIARKITPVSDLTSLIQLFRHFRSMKFDVVHSITPKAGLICVLAGKAAGVHHRIHIFTGQVWHTKRGLFRFLLKMIDRLISACATVVLVDGASQRSYLIDQGVVSSSRAVVLGKGSISGVDIERFRPNDELRARIRTDLGISREEKVFMYLGRLNRDKGIPELVDAFKKLLGLRDDVRLILVGSDEEHLESELSSDLPEGNRIVFVGYTSKPEEILQACDIFCLPSHREGFGTSVIEASAMGKPVICSDTYGLMETIVPGQTGLRHEVKSVESIYDKMVEIISDADRMTSMGIAGRDYVDRHFSADKISAEWVRFYRELLHV